MNKKQIEESLNYKKYRTLSKVPDDILRKYQEENKSEGNNNKKPQWKYRIAAVFVIVVILGIGIFAGLNRRDDTVSSLNENDSVADEMVVEETDNILMADNADGYGGILDSAGNWPVFGSDIARKDVISITFLDTIDNAPDDCWDVSYIQNGTVFAWVEKQEDGYDLYIAAEGGVKGSECDSLFATYSRLRKVEFGDCFDTSSVSCMDNMFRDCSNLKTVDVENLNTENVISMNSMFFDCIFLELLDVSTWDVHNLMDAIHMFSGCFSLTMLDVSSWDTGSLVNTNGMFLTCSNLTMLDVSNWDTSNMIDMSYMFKNCRNLTTLDVSNWDTSNVTDMRDMFSDCENLTTLDVSNWDTSNVTSMRNMFYDCKSLTWLDTSNWDKSNVEDMHAMYYGVNESVLKQYK